jgi:ZIP family zinc transporter
MPLYYATGSKKKAFFWAFVSGISEPIGAVVCYLVFFDGAAHTAHTAHEHACGGSDQLSGIFARMRAGFNTVVYGVLFGMIAGMMVFITLKELLPTAHKYDTSDTIVTPFIFIGMAVMGGSLLLFDYA